VHSAPLGALRWFDNMLSVNAVQTSGLTRKASAELTRRKLIDGAIELLRRDGVAAATTGRIASAAGLKQPSFYVHFDDRDQVFEAAAVEIGRRVMEILRRQLTDVDLAHPQRSIRAGYAAMTQAFLSEPELTRLFLRHRIDDGTVLGRTFRRLLDEAREQLVLGVARYGVVVPRPVAEAHSELLVAGVLGLLEGLVDGRLRDREAAVDAISNVTIAMFRSLSRDRNGAAPASAAAGRSRPKDQK
jgi:TetR/AcrR family transcriptional regulator, fatty acid biosynthesis regulator